MHKNYDTNEINELSTDYVSNVLKLSDCWKSTAIMSTNAVCFLLLKKYKNGTTLEQLAKELSIMRDNLLHADRDIGFSGNSKSVVKHAVSIL